MTEALKDALARAADEIGSAEPDLPAIERRGRHRRVRRHGVTGVVAVVVTAAIALPLYGLSGIGAAPGTVTPGSGLEGIVFSTSSMPDAPGQIYRMNPDGTGLTRITNDDAEYSSVAASPDGARIAFVRFTGASPATYHEGIYVANADGSGMHEVLRAGDPMPISVTQVRWSPDGSTIGFIKREMSSGSEADWPSRLWFMNADGSDAHIVLDRQIVAFDWSPDGASVVFEQQGVDAGTFTDDLFVTKLRAEPFGAIDRLTDDGASRQPVWAPSGATIAYTDGWAPSSSANLFDLETSTGRVLADPSGMTDVLAWSPTGDELLASNVDASACSLLVIGADGGRRTIFQAPTAGARANDASSDTGPGCVQAAGWVAGPEASSAQSASPTAVANSTVTPVGDTLSESVLLDKEPGVRCTASIPSVVEPGAELGLTMTLENTSDATVEVSPYGPSFPVRVRAGDGTVWDTADLMNHSWPMVEPTSLAPGESTPAQLAPLKVQFAGPLTVTPTCAGETMPPLHVDVADPGATPTPEDAVARAVGATSGLFEACAPTPNSNAVGTVSPPDDPSLSIDVRCAAQVMTAPGFAVVTLVMSSPSDLASPIVPDGILAGLDLPADRGNSQTIAWRFVVTSDGVVPVASEFRSRTVAADAMDTEFEVSSRGWKAGGESRCGGDASSLGGDGSTVTVAFNSACG